MTEAQPAEAMATPQLLTLLTVFALVIWKMVDSLRDIDKEEDE